jgi:hypothetical protein
VEDNGIVHILDVVFIKKDADGLVTSFEYDGLDDVLQLGGPDRLGAPLGGAGRPGHPGRRRPHRRRRAGPPRDRPRALADGQPVE